MRARSRHWWPGFCLVLLPSCSPGGPLDQPLPAPARESSPAVSGAAESDCDLRVAFGSFATGIDRDAAAAVERLISEDESVIGVTRSPYGPEGEYAICVHTRSAEASARLFDSLRETLRRPVDAPVSVTGPGGSFSLPTRR